MKVYKHREANCSFLFSDVTCAGFTGYDTTRKLIVLSIRGSHGVHQYYDLWKVGNENGTVPFLGVGRVTKVFHDNFESLWYGGLGEDTQVDREERYMGSRGAVYARNTKHIGAHRASI
ncbi:Protein CBG10125 [Caenorhabditis briggsae]|uniref:Protein CBG10125 n=1 Tax=Caenorhabditis briggsae TaxID=6238 RepID=A8XAG0_CAEBR|nr:Protein CBG10125 [Caenorhabditis briggsae]CAP29628.1 Protein CBG10125 [Caenorhabditis briggsae]